MTSYSSRTGAILKVRVVPIVPTMIFSISLILIIELEYHDYFSVFYQYGTIKLKCFAQTYQP